LGPIKPCRSLDPYVLGEDWQDELHDFRKYYSCRQSSTASPLRQLISLGRSITALRNNQELDGQQLAAKAGLRHWRLTAVEEGRLDLDYASLVRLADALNIDLAKLVEHAETGLDHA
jgi:hypothetical protein